MSSKKSTASQKVAAARSMSAKKQNLNKVKMEAANEVGVNLKEGYNGDLTSRQAGSVGGQMVNNVLPVRHQKFTRKSRVLDNHEQVIEYAVKLVI